MRITISTETEDTERARRKVGVDLETHHTQGGGTVAWDTLKQAYVFVDPPAAFSFKAGDVMPKDWGIA